MIWANAEGERGRAKPGAIASCPICDADLLPKCGPLVTWHWAHQPAAPCSDTWAEESEWHRAWKEWAHHLGWETEATVVKRGVRHQADILTPKGWVIELQHSAISSREIAVRERFYGRVIWIFDMAGKEERFTLNERAGWVGIRWRQAARSLTTIRTPLYLDFAGRGILQARLALKPHSIRDHNMCIGRGQWRSREDLAAAFSA